MLNILFEDKSMIVVRKPAGMATQTAGLRQKDMVSEIKNYLSRKPELSGKGQPYAGVVHRLDQPVEGILAVARTKQAAAGLSSQMSGKTAEKYYYALVFGNPPAEQGALIDFLYQDNKTNTSGVVSRETAGAREARLSYRRLESQGGIAHLEVKLETGRHHQIRVQLAHAGMPLIGDIKYGSAASREKTLELGCSAIALCAYKLVLRHPLTNEKMMFEIQPENQVFSSFFTK